MERLTKRDENGTAFIVLDENSKEWSVSVEQSSYAHTIECEAVDKLADYEDAEEQGLLLRLPCKVGDTLYMPWDYDCNTGVAVMTVYKICIDEEGFFVETDLDSDSEGFLEEYNYGEFSFYDFGKTVFLTKEEAEKKLAEMKGV